MIIRRATREDTHTLAMLCAVVQQVHIDSEPDLFKPVGDDLSEFIAFFERLLPQETVHIYLAEINRLSVGYIFATVNRPTRTNPFMKPFSYLQVEHMATHPDYRRQGIGNALMQQIIALAEAEILDYVTLTVWSFNSGAFQFYEDLGFKIRHQSMVMALKP